MNEDSSLTNTRSQTHCLNCETPLAGPFCPRCGQRAIPPYPTVRELANDAFHEVSGWDGRFAMTLRTLFRWPGELTREFLAGRRRRYISPIRLYLVASVVYFLAAAASPNTSANPALVDLGGVRIGVFTPSTRTGDAATAARGVQGARSGQLTADERRAALESIEEAPLLVQPILRRAVDSPEGLQGGILRAMPRMLIALLPIFAGILALFYRGRHYPEHLYFAIHLHAFIFLALAFSQLAQITGWTPLVRVVAVVVVVWIPVYAIKSLRRVYGGSLSMTVAKGVGIATLYAVAAAPVMFGLLAWAAKFA
jgi:hypothetical protein